MKSRFFKMKPKSLQNIKATFWSSCKSSWKWSFPVDFISWRGKTASELFKASVHMNLTSTASQLLDNQWSNSLITALLCLQHFFQKIGSCPFLSFLCLSWLLEKQSGRDGFYSWISALYNYILHMYNKQKVAPFSHLAVLNLCCQFWLLYLCFETIPTTAQGLVTLIKLF